MNEGKQIPPVSLSDGLKLQAQKQSSAYKVVDDKEKYKPQTMEPRV